MHHILGFSLTAHNRKQAERKYIFDPQSPSNITCTRAFEMYKGGLYLQIKSRNLEIPNFYSNIGNQY